MGKKNFIFLVYKIPHTIKKHCTGGMGLYYIILYGGLKLHYKKMYSNEYMGGWGYRWGAKNAVRIKWDRISLGVFLKRVHFV